MPATCIKEFALHVEPAVSLIDYWDFDDAGPPFTAKVAPGFDNLDVTSGPGGIAGGAVGILGTAMRISGVAIGTPSRIFTVDFNPETVIKHGFTWTTWVNFATFGDASESVIFQVIFANAGGVTQLDARAGTSGIGPGFLNIVVNGSNIFSPTAAYGVGVWNLIRVQFDIATLKFGVQRANIPFGIGGMEHSGPIANNLSAIVKGNLSLQCVRGLFSAASPDYRQDESGFWGRLLTDAEFATLFGGGTPPAYPNVP